MANKARARGAWCILLKGNGKPLKDFARDLQGLPFEKMIVAAGWTVD